MALIVECRSCGRRVPEDTTACPDCQSPALRYIIDWWPKGRRGGRKQCTLPKGTSLEKALAMEEAVMALKRGPVAAPSSASTVADLFDDYLSWYRLHRKVSTWHDVSGAWERDLKRILGGYMITSIEAAHYSLYQKMRTGVSNRTINKELDYFSGFIHWCRREKKMAIPRIEYEKLPYSKPIPIVLSPAEIIRIIAAAESEPVYHAFLLVLYTLGLRISAARGIKVEDFDFENRGVRVLQKGGNWKLLPISDHVIEAVKRLIKSKELKAGQHVFSVQKSGQPVQNIRKAIARICKRAGVTKKVHPHLFRHTVATHMIAAGVNTRTVQNYMDHAEITTTEGYTHIALENLRAAQDKAISTKNPYESAGTLSGCEYNI